MGLRAWRCSTISSRSRRPSAEKPWTSHALHGAHWQHLELVDGDGGGAVTWLSLPRFPGLSVTEGDGPTVEGGDAAVRDDDPVGIAGDRGMTADNDDTMAAPLFPAPSWRRLAGKRMK